MTKPITQENRISLSSSLSSYAKDKKIFTRPEANTFGLLEWGEAKEAAESLISDQLTVDETIDRVAKASK